MTEVKSVPKIRFPGFTDAWEQRKLGDIATFINGRAYSQDELLDSGKYQVLRVGNFYTNDSWYYSDLELGDKYYAEEGDLLYTWSATFGPHIWRGDKVIYHYHIWKVELSESLEKLFALQLLEQDKASILSNKNGSTMVHITKAGMEEKTVTIPKDIREQKKIGLFFEALDTTITLHQRKCENLRVLKKGMLQKMFPKEGKNVPEVRFPGFTDAWEQRKFNDISEKLCVGFVGTCEKYYTDKAHGIPMYRTGNIKNGFLVEDDMKYVTRDFHEKNKKSQLKKNDILIARFGENGLGAQYLKDEEANCLNCIILRSNAQANAEYVKQYLSSDTFRKKAFANTVGSTFSILNTTTLGKMDIPFTSLPEQAAIAKFLSNLDNLITLHQRKCDELIKCKQGLLQQMFV